MGSERAIRILSTDAPKAGVRRCAALFAEETGNPFRLEFAPAPIVAERVSAGNAEADLLVATEPVLKRLAGDDLIDGSSIAVLGSVLVGVVIRSGASRPDLSSVDAFAGSLMAADQIVYNTASSGLYAAEILARLGLATKLGPKIVVVERGVGVMEYLAAEKTRNAIGFGHVTEIRAHDALGTELIGPLPAEIGRNTVYAGALPATGVPAEAGALLALMVSPRGKGIFVASGVL
jgi:molybdate transport system substrate-binding protein